MRKIDALAFRDLGQVQGVGGGAAQERGLLFVQELQPRAAVQGAARKAQAAQALGGFESEPEADEGAEGKGEEGAVLGGDAGAEQDLAPDLDHRGPGLGRVEPSQGAAGGGAGAVQAHVARERKRQVGPVRRILVLVRGQLGFVQQGQAPQVLEAGDGFVQARGFQARSPEGIGTAHDAQQLAQARELALLQLSPFRGPGPGGFGPVHAR